MGSTMRMRRDHPHAVVLVEGVSDQLALEALAERRGRNLAAEGVSVLPIGGAQAIGRFVDRFGPRGLGVYVCVADLEDELIRALGADAMEDVIDAHGELGSFRTLQNQPAWRGRAAEAQLHRFLGSQSRKTTVRSLVRALAPDGVPRPLDRVLASV